MMAMNTTRFPYRAAFNESSAAAFRTRLPFFCSFTILLYLAVSFLCLILDPVSFRKAEIFIWIFLIASAVLALVMNRLAGTLARAKTVTALFSLSVLVVVAALFVIYPSYLTQSSEVFALAVFLISFIMPWKTSEVIAIGALTIIGYSGVFLWAMTAFPRFKALILDAGGYVDGIIFLVIAILICVMVRMRDNARERESFALMKELEEKNAQMRQELAIAREVHRTLIPKSTSTDNATIAVSYIPLSTVGGDYATFHVTKEGGLFFLIGDVTGHGVPAALLVNRIYGEVENLVNKNPAPGALMMELNAFVQEHFQATNMYFSVCSGLIDFKLKKLFYSNYGHPPQILRRHKDNRIRLLESQTYFLGIDDNAAGAGQSVFEGNFAFDGNDRIVLFTDGLIETKNGADEMYGMERLEAFINERADEHPSLFNANLLKEIDAFRSGPVADDMFLVTIDIK